MKFIFMAIFLENIKIEELKDVKYMKNFNAI